MHYCFKNKRSWILIILFMLLLFIWLSGIVLDLEAERVVSQRYSRDKNGVIEGAQSWAIKREHHKNALVFIHGFLDTPAMFLDLAHDIEHKVDADIYAPLLPFHGRDLQTARQFNNQIIMDDIEKYLNQLAKKYDCVTVVGLSYGGSVLTALAVKGGLAANIKIVLYAPAIHLKTNTFANRLGQAIYSIWRNYCNYASLGCEYPVYDSADATSISAINKEIALYYSILPALKQLYALDLQNRKGLARLHRPYSLLIAVDDNRVAYDMQKAFCDQNKPYCHFYPFSSGRHIIHYGAKKKEFEDLIIKLAACSSL